MRNATLIEKIGLTHDLTEGCQKEFSTPFQIRAYENGNETITALGVCKDDNELCVYTTDEDNYVIPLTELTNRELHQVYKAIVAKC